MAAPTTREEVRLLIFDPSDGSGNPLSNTANVPLITDDQIDFYLSRYTDDTERVQVLYASADICLIRAASAVERGVSSATGGTFSHDSRRVPENWMKYSKELRELGDSEPEGDYAEMNVSLFAQHDIREAALRRSTG